MRSSPWVHFAKDLQGDVSHQHGPGKGCEEGCTDSQVGFGPLGALSEEKTYAHHFFANFFLSYCIYSNLQIWGISHREVREECQPAVGPIGWLSKGAGWWAGESPSCRLILDSTYVQLDAQGETKRFDLTCDRINLQKQLVNSWSCRTPDMKLKWCAKCCVY